jgi:hypothetical protein
MGEVKNLIVIQAIPPDRKECVRCGECCKNLILTGNFSDKTKAWLEARGCGFLPDGRLIIPFKCPHLKKLLKVLSEDGMSVTEERENSPYGEWFCDIYETRPEVCKEYRCWK